jgi:hypothetical protein
MAKWLYNSNGSPVAFINGDNVFSLSGSFIGRLDDNEIWYGSYKGEILKEDRILYKVNHSSVIHGIPGTPGTPGIPGIPGSKGVISLPSGYEDVKGIK